MIEECFQLNGRVSVVSFMLTSYTLLLAEVGAIIDGH